MNLTNYILNQDRKIKQLIVIFLDVNICLLSVWLAFTLRYEQYNFPSANHLYIYFLSLILFIPIFIIFKLYQGIFRYFGLENLRSITYCIIIYTFFFIIIINLIKLPNVPRSVGIIQPIIFYVLIIVSRIQGLSLFKKFFLKKAKNTIIYGAGFTGVNLLNSLIYNDEHKVKFFLDDDINKHNKYINGVPIKKSDELKINAHKYNIEIVLIAIPNLDLDKRRKFINDFLDLNIKIFFINDNFKFNNIPLDYQNINIADLIDRKVINSDSRLDLHDKLVLVTGAAGSIGSELSIQILQMRPKKLLLLDFSETSLYILEKYLKSKFVNEINTCKFILLNILDKGNLENIFKKFKPNIIFHTAAYKHVPIVEENINMAVKNNIIGTINLLKLTENSSVENFIYISTDKAVKPTNTMGASKRMSEIIIQNMAKQNKNTLFSIVRFGNVIASSGSMTLLFHEQIKNGGPITVTHPDVTRFFMTINEAVSLIISTLSLSKGGEVFLFDMGKPIRILDIAKKMIKLSGLKEQKEENVNEGGIYIKFIGLRKGEKLHEELLISSDLIKTNHEYIYKAFEKFPLIDINKIENKIMHLSSFESEINIINFLEKYVENFVRNHD